MNSQKRPRKISPRKLYEEENPPGQKVLKMANESQAIRFIAEKFSILQLAEDVHFMWHDAQSPEEKREVHRFYRRELRRAVPSTVLIELGILGALHSNTVVLVTYCCGLPILGLILYLMFK